jgi:hypothetical protein
MENTYSRRKSNRWDMGEENPVAFGKQRNNGPRRGRCKFSRRSPTHTTDVDS